MNLTNNIIKLSVRSLVEFVFRSGDIDSTLGTGSDTKAMQEGARIHRMLQKAAGSRYHAEVPLKIVVERLTNNGISYEIQLEGRADGILCDLAEDEHGCKYPVSDVIIDEIKTMQNGFDYLLEPIYVHKAQVLCYAYIYLTQQQLEKIDVRLTYCNAKTEEIKQFSEQIKAETLKEWFDSLIETFSKWTDFVLQQQQKRKQTILDLQFPYEYRQGQRNLVVSVYKTIQQKRNLYIQASTGVGKTLSTVFPTVAAMGQAYVDKIFYLTSKTITRTVAEDTFELLRKHGLHLRTVTLTAKEKICFCKGKHCNPQECAYAKGHFDRINAAVYNVITDNLVIDRACIEKYAVRHQVCPFEMELDISNWCDGIICDYNYVFDPKVALKRYFGEGTKGDYVFLVDEAHNLVDRAREMYSAVLIKEDFLKVKKVLGNVPYAKRIVSYLQKCNKSLLALKRKCDTYNVLDKTEELGKLPEELTYLAMEIASFFEKGIYFLEKDMLLEFYFQVKFFLTIYDGLDEKYIIYTEHNDNGNFCLRLFCVDPSGNIAQRLDMGRSTVFFSATLLPVNYFKEMLSGKTDDYAVYAESSFDAANRCVLVANDVSSRYAKRNDNEYQKICRYIFETVTIHQGNYMVYFPSYSYLQAVTALFEQMYQINLLKFEDLESDEIQEAAIPKQDNVKIYLAVQKASMEEAEKEWLLKLFNKNRDSKSLVGFCVIGGTFSEGIDLREDSLIGVIIIGTGLPMICRQRDILRAYFDDIGKDGFAYAYLYPGMNKVLQAAGRVIRTAKDKGIIELLDNRLLRSEYRSLYPKEWKQVATVSQNHIKDIISEFWKNVVQYRSL